MSYGERTCNKYGFCNHKNAKLNHFLFCNIKCDGYEIKKINRYVVGFAFAKNNNVLLIKKTRPEWQKGLLNGIGGKIESSETPIQAMNRECFEESGLELNWIHRGIMSGTNNDGSLFECHIFYTCSDNVYNFQQKTDEILSLYDPLILGNCKTLANVPFLIQFGLSPDKIPFLKLQYGQ